MSNGFHFTPRRRRKKIIIRIKILKKTKWVAKARSCDLTGVCFFTMNPPELWCLEEAGSQKLHGLPTPNFGARRSRRLGVGFDTN